MYWILLLNSLFSHFFLNEAKLNTNVVIAYFKTFYWLARPFFVHLHASFFSSLFFLLVLRRCLGCGAFNILALTLTVQWNLDESTRPLDFVVKEVVKLVGPTLVLAGRRSSAAYIIWMMPAAPNKHASRNKKYMFFITEAIFFFF